MKQRDRADGPSVLEKMLGPLLEQFADYGAEVQARFPARWVVDTLTSSALKFLIDRALAAGVPDSFAERFKLDNAQAKIIYEAVLKDALTRV